MIGFGKMIAVVVLASLGTGYGQVQSPQAYPSAVPEYRFEVVKRFPHDATAFTQGLAYRDGFFYEGTGLKGGSSLRKVQVETGEVLRKVELPGELFGEGVTLLGDEAIQLTWQSHTGFVYELKDFRRLKSFIYSGEGWGLAASGRELFLSDGSDEIRVLDASSFRVKRRLKVHDGAAPVTQLNELEVVEGEIFANVWHSDRIARISAHTGAVVGWIDLTGLLSPMYQLQPEAVLNGIAYDSVHKRLFVTGKLWPAVFEIKLVRKGNDRHSRR